MRLFESMGRDKNTVSTQPLNNKKLGNMSIPTLINLAKEEMKLIKDDYTLISTEEQFKEYIDHCIFNDIVAIDTETKGLDPLRDAMVGGSLFTYETKAIYLPMEHVGLKNRLETKFITEQFERLKNTKKVMFNGVFDTRVIWNNLGFRYTNLYWEAYVAAKLLNTNEKHNKLKPLWDKYCSDKVEKSKQFKDIFGKITLNNFPAEVVYPYAASDAKKTLDLYDYQKEQFDKPENQALYAVLNGRELPLVDVIVKQENRGIFVDTELADNLSKDYHKQIDSLQEQFYMECRKIQFKINEYMTNNPKHKLEIPIKITSNDQLAILLYDILGFTNKLYKESDTSNKKISKRSTGVKVLQTINHPLVEIILEYRRLSKLTSTYLDALPKKINPNTNRIHCKFNQVGAKTGRLSSNNPNLQNIPAKNKEIRQIFIPRPGYAFIFCDFSSQEPRILAHMTQDERMLKAFADGKDLYIEVASIVNNVPPEECMEHKDGLPYPEGKKRRNSAKNVLLGTLYGRGVSSIALQIGATLHQTKKIHNDIMDEFVNLKSFISDSIKMAKELGYVTTFTGRRRHLPQASLPKYELKTTNKVPEENKEYYKTYYLNLLENTKSWEEIKKIKAGAKINGVIVIDNSGYIAEAERQSVNSRIQGGGGDVTKKAMIEIDNDKQLADLGYELLLSIHDETGGECPIENVQKCAELVKQASLRAFDDLCVVGEVDVEITDRWFGKELEFDDLEDDEEYENEEEEDLEE